MPRGEEAAGHVWAKGSSVSAKGRQVDGSTLFFLTFRTSIGRPMRRLNPVCKESALKPSNPFVLATRRLPPATPCEPGVLTVCCSSPHAWIRRPYDRQYLKMTMPTLFGGPVAPLCGYSHRMSRISHGMCLLQPRQCGLSELTGGSSRGRGSTLGSQNTRGPVTVAGPWHPGERGVRLPAQDPVRHRPLSARRAS